MQPPEMFYKKGDLKYFAKSAQKHLCQSLFFHNKHLVSDAAHSTLSQIWLWGNEIADKKIKLQGEAYIFIKKETGTGVFLQILQFFYEHHVLQKTSCGYFSH